MYPVAINDYLIHGRELIYGDIRDPATINFRLNKVWDALPAAEKTLPPHPGLKDREIRHVLIEYMKVSEGGRITIPPLAKGEGRTLPGQIVDWPTVRVDAGTPAKGRRKRHESNRVFDAAELYDEPDERRPTKRRLRPRSPSDSTAKVCRSGLMVMCSRFTSAERRRACSFSPEAKSSRSSGFRRATCGQ